MAMHPFDDPFGPSGNTFSDIFARPKFAGGGRRGPVKADEASKDGPEPLEAAPEEKPAGEEKPAEEEKPKVILKNPKWEAEEVGFNEETDISIEAEIPEAHAHKTKIAFELFAKTPDGPESVSKADGQAKDGKALARIPVYMPSYKDGEGNLLSKVDYYFTARHGESDLFKDEKAIKTVDHMADRLIDSHVLQDVTFATGKSFPRTGQAGDLKALGAAVKAWRDKHPEARLAVFGHADAVGREKDNKTLSERRGHALQAFLAKEPAAWEALYNEERWGLATSQELLKHLGHNPGAIDGKDGHRTRSAVKAFQAKKGLKEDGVAGPKTREALYLAFMEDCESPGCKSKDFDAIDGSPYAGCSEFNLAKKAEGECAANRRVTALLLKSNRNFPIQYPCKKGDIGPCRKQADRKGDRRNPGFKCLFYDQLMKEEKKGGEPAPTGPLKWVGVEEGEEVRQYVNLKPEGKGLGPERAIEVAAEGIADGTKVYWKVTAAKENSARNKPKPGLKPDAGGKLAGFSSGEAELVTKVEKGKASCVLACGLAGGDRFTVEVGLEKGKAAGRFTVVNWRKLYYQVTRPKDVVPSIDKLNHAMSAIHVECEKTAEVEIQPEDGPAGSWVDGEDMGKGSGRKLAVGKHNREHFHKLFKSAKGPIEAHFMFCHYQLDGESTPESLDLTGRSSSMITLPGEASKVRGVSFTASSALPGYLIFPIALQSGKPSVTAYWKSDAASGPHKGRTGEIPADHIVVDFKNHAQKGGQVFAKFPPEAAAVVEAGAKITLSFSVEVAKGWYNGESDGHLLLIAAQRTRAGGATIDWEGINGTMGHELGHAMKMVAMSSLDIPGIGNVRKAHGRWYNTSRGHQGDHCAFGVPKDKYKDPKVRMAGQSGTCVMFGASVDGRSHTFCELCAPLLHGADLSTISKSSK